MRNSQKFNHFLFIPSNDAIGDSNYDFRNNFETEVKITYLETDKKFREGTPFTCSINWGLDGKTLTIITDYHIDPLYLTISIINAYGSCDIDIGKYTTEYLGYHCIKNETVRVMQMTFHSYQS
jgi:hypothetical protein